MAEEDRNQSNPSTSAAILVEKDDVIEDDENEDEDEEMILVSLFQSYPLLLKLIACRIVVVVY